MNSEKKSVHKPILMAAAAALKEIFQGQGHADKVIEYHMRLNRKWGSRDRRQFAEMAYDMVRWWRLLLVMVLNKDLGDALSDLEFQTLVNSYLEEFDLAARQRLAKTVAIRESVPDELYRLLKDELDGDADEYLSRMNRKAPQFLRVNTLKTSLEKLKIKLSSEQIETKVVAGVSTALQLTERKNVFQTDAYKQGWFEMQDGGSQLVAPLLNLRPGDRVVDACAGAGGKTLHLAMLLKNKGRVVAMDIHQRKLDELATRAKRAGVTIIEPRLIEGTKDIKRLHETADHVLLDVPCSGLGVVRRYPDTKFKIKTTEISKLAEIQQDILNRYSLMAKPGGAVVYATCSVLPSENEKRVAAFLAQSKGQFELEEELRVSVLKTEFDGFYAARIRRKN